MPYDDAKLHETLGLQLRCSIWKRCPGLLDNLPTTAAILKSQGDLLRTDETALIEAEARERSATIGILRRDIARRKAAIAVLEKGDEEGEKAMLSAMFDHAVQGRRLPSPDVSSR